MSFEAEMTIAAQASPIASTLVRVRKMPRDKFYASSEEGVPPVATFVSRADLA